ncbi:uncharacterized protein LOC108677695 [Hyalella azteca]|uniref:Uncharacterized protein LOC108677695 n=1 Tax=Hyalella azteca TaxID=294128 RepID=A0A8B7P5X2_HYAAZ|nr:uncharacterized protein LOC108677695 [Hyalella azteca]XP_018021449.1 uncharacterized protein LOC108677695 [Hyalella azteca]
MVAEFRLAKPNTFFVNINPSNSHLKSDDNRSSEEDSSPLLKVVRGNIIRRGDSNLLSTLLEAAPELRSTIMGTQNPEDFENSPYSGHSMNFSISRSSVDNTHNQLGPGSSHAAGQYSADSSRQDGGYSHTSAVSGSPGSLNDNLQSNASTPTTGPHIRLADFSRASSFGMSNQDSQPQFYAPNSVTSTAASYGNHGVGQVPTITVIRSTETIEFTPNLNHSQLQNAGVAAHGSSPYGQSAGFVGDSQRRTNRSVRPKHHLNQNGLCANSPCDHGDLLRDRESLIRENETLKRKLKLLATTINDEEKLNKLLRCLRGSRAPTS